MATVLKAQKRTIILENVTHIQVLPDGTLLFPAGFYTIRLVGEDAEKAVELAKLAGFVGNSDLLVNPKRLVVAEEENATARLMLDGQVKQLIVPVQFLAHLEQTSVPIPSASVAGTVSSAGKRGTVVPGGSVDPAKKKSADDTARIADTGRIA